MANRIQASKQSTAIKARPQTTPALAVISAAPDKKRHRIPVKTVQVVLGCLFALGILAHQHMTVTKLTKEVASHEVSLEHLHNEYVALKAEQDRLLSLEDVESYAQNKLGMVKMDTSRYEYMDMQAEDQVEVREHAWGMASIKTGLQTMIHKIAHFFGLAG